MPEFKLDICLLGGFKATVNQNPLPKLHSRHGIRLLALLALRANRNVERTFLAGQLWPDLLESQSLPLLRRELAELRAALGDQRERIQSPQRSVLRLDITSAPWGAARIDVRQFEELAGHPTDMRRLDSALALYVGPFLEGFYDDWVMIERDRLAQLFLSVLESRTTMALKANEFEFALPLIRRGLAIAPFDERWSCHLMETLARLGRDGEMVAAYERLCQRFRRELSAEPGRETRDLYQRLRQLSRSRPSVESPAVPARAADVKMNVSRTVVPVYLTRFIGREAERAQLQSLAATTDPSGSRLITVSGLGGSGKTRLSVEVVQQLHQDGIFVAGIYFFELSELRTARQLADALSDAFGVTAANANELLFGLQSALQEQTSNNRPLLIVLDNLEQLLIDSEILQVQKLVSALLEAVPHLRLLVTSRQALRLPGEAEFPLDPLPWEPDRTGEKEAPSVELFLDRVRSIKPDFALTPQNEEAVQALCRRLEGMPLAIEMAATWARVLSPAQMLARFSQPLRVAASGRSTGARHQSMRTTLEWSFELLPKALQNFLVALSVFRGSFSLEAVEATLGPLAIESLSELSERSLVVTLANASSAPRYRLLEFVREFAEEKQRRDPEASSRQQSFIAFYVEMVRAAEGMRVGNQVQAWRALILADYHNLQEAMEACVERQEGESLLSLCQSLAVYWILQNEYREGCAWLERALRLTESDPMSLLRARVMMRLGNLYAHLGRYQETIALTNEASAYFEGLEDSPERNSGMILGGYNRDYIFNALGDRDGALRVAEDSVATARRMSNRSVLAVSLATQGSILTMMGRESEALPILEEAVRLLRTAEDVLRLGLTLCHLTACYVSLGDVHSAYASILEAMDRLPPSAPPAWHAYSLRCYGYYLRNRGALPEASNAILQAYRHLKNRAIEEEHACILEEWARLEREAARPERAVFLFSAAGGIRLEVASLLFAPEAAEVEGAFCDCIERWGESEAHLWRSRGRTVRWEEIESRLEGDAQQGES